MAHAAEVYAKRQGLAKESIDHAHAIMVDAMTLMGEFIKFAKENGELNKGAMGAGINQHNKELVRFPKSTAPTLADSGITKKQSSHAQTLAKVAVASPETHAKVRAGELTVKQAHKVIKDAEKERDLDDKAAAVAASDVAEDDSIYKTKAAGLLIGRPLLSRII